MTETTDGFTDAHSLWVDTYQIEWLQAVRSQKHV